MSTVPHRDQLKKQKKCPFRIDREGAFIFDFKNQIQTIPGMIQPVIP